MNHCYRAPLDEELLPSPRTTWIIGGLGAFAIHAACGFIAIHYSQLDATDFGAPGMVVDVDLAAPDRDIDNLPVGPDSQSAAPSPAIAEQRTVAQQTDMPTALPDETGNPDQIVKLQKTIDPDEEILNTTSLQITPSNTSVTAQETAVPPVATAQESPHSTTASPGTGESVVRERMTWQKELAVHFDKFKRYPADRDRLGAEVIVTFVLDRSGHIVTSRITKGSGDSSFDEAALAMLRRADPVPPPPRLVADNGLSFTLPVIFQFKSPR